MVFVDGENLTIRAQHIARERSDVIALAEGPMFRRDVFLWFPGMSGYWLPSEWGEMSPKPIRSHYYTSVSGDSQLRTDVRRALRDIGFHPEVFSKSGKEKAKGVDIALTKDMLSHAFFGNYEAAVLVAGDGDYLPLVTEVQRLGKQVFLAFFASNGLNPELKLAADGFMALEGLLQQRWPRR